MSPEDLDFDLVLGLDLDQVVPVSASRSKFELEKERRRSVALPLLEIIPSFGVDNRKIALILLALFRGEC